MCIRDRLKTFTRILYTSKSYTLSQLHIQIFSYLRPLFEAELSKLQSEEICKMSDEALFNKVFPKLTEEKWHEANPKDLPYVIKFVNINLNDHNEMKKCYYYGNYDCGNCLIPFSSKITVGDMINKVNSKRIDNLYDEQLFSNSNYFKLELIFNRNQEKAIISNTDFECTRAIKTEAGEGIADISIYDCLNNFVKWETLDKDNFWYCPSCKLEVSAKKKLEFTRAPPILVLHLKRFKTNSQDQFTGSDRINTLIDFPLVGLDFSKYLKDATEPVFYDLCAVSNHYGSISSGHYTAYAWNKHHKAWHKFDDSSVNEEDADNVCSSAAYVLFYKRRDVEEEIDYAKLKQVIPESYKVSIKSAAENE
eukprot:TRINITY_DN6691_c0_g1_i6.p1 TRINITY_DN6691_c0_g1~~TRINITY_DN6691_c0_g1_i6.p1  ORF type:complete len:379 (+),score=71.81 TRINITY_DN6691_c0_g1_i6:48-1139(+)